MSENALDRLAYEYAGANANLNLDEARRAVEAHARRWGGCVSCANSAVHPDHPSWTIRECRLGLRQDECGEYEPVLGGEDTSVRLPRALVERARVVAAERGVSLKTIISEMISAALPRQAQD